jgi:hypothetical protein
MAMKLKLDWPRCPEGVRTSPTSEEWQLPAGTRWEEVGPLSGIGRLVEVPITSFMNKSDKIELASYEVTSLDTAFVIAFVNATTTEARRRFLNNYGFPLPTMGAPVREPWIAHLQGILHRLLLAAGGDDPRHANDTVTAVLSAYDTTNAYSPLSPWAPPPDPPGGPGKASPGPAPLLMRPTMEYQPGDATPQIVCRAPTFYALMMLECAVVAERGTRAYECQYCSNVYLVGALTNRRAKGFYCSDSCRVMGLRLRKEGKVRAE